MMSKEVAERLPADHPARRFQRPGVRAAFLISVPFVVIGAMLWGILGALCTLPAMLVAIVSTASTWALYVALPSGVASVVDWPVVLTIGFIALVALRPKARWIPVGIWLVLAAFSIVRASLLQTHGIHTAARVVHALVALAIIAPPWISVCHRKLWVPASLEALDEVEEAIYRRFIVSDFSMQNIAGLGTVVVPYCGDETRVPPRNLVLVHGYLAGNAFWAANLQALAKFFNVYAVEWKGIGRSVRPPYPSKLAHENDAFFVESIEEWRQALGLERFVLCAHSMGAMFCSYYTLKYTPHVEQLILLSPAGVAPTQQPETLPAIYRWVMRLQITPMSMLRFAGPLGMKLSRWTLRKRIAWVPPSNVIRSGQMDFNTIAAYSYHNWALPASGDRCVHTHLRLPGARAPQRPLRDIFVPGRPGVPLTLMYGSDHDWMPSEAGEALVRRLEKTQYAVLRLVPDAGHQIFMDNPAVFSQMLIDAILDCERAHDKNTTQSRAPAGAMDARSE